MDHFSRSWAALLTAVADLPDEAFALIPRLAAAYGDPALLQFHTDVLLIGTGRRTATVEERTALGGLAERIPLILG